MSPDKIAIRIIPTPATQDISSTDLARLSRLTKLSEERIKERISRGTSIVIVTTKHPRVEDAIALIKSMGFSVTTGAPSEEKSPSSGAHSRPRSYVREADEWRVGDIIENLYEVIDIKQGGMGAVYVVRHRRWNSMMAIKSLLMKLRKNEEDRALFVKEAETWIDIGFHPNIAACYYVRNIGESPRIFIEYVDGGALNEWLNRRQQVGWRILLDLMVQVSDGLQHAHSKGLVHRDVKPGNCMMTRDGVLKVTDFGLTKRRGLPGTPDGTSDSLVSNGVPPERESITAAGMGTPGYMAPEMWIPHSEVGPAADIYAFGVMFFELCCGRKPFLVKPGEGRDKLALAHVKKPPPRPSSIVDDIPESIERIILKCLQKNPEDRFPSFGSVREALAGAYEKIVKKRYTREAPDEVKLLSDALNNRAVSLMDLNHAEEALGALKRAMERDPHHPEAVYNLAMLEWQRTGNPDWEIVVKLEEVIKTPEYLGRGADLLARCLLRLGDAPRALQACELALSTENATEAWLKPYSIALIGVGKAENAVDHLKNYLDRFPNDDEAVGWLISGLHRSGRVREAASWIDLIPKGSEISGLSAEEISETFLFPGLTETKVFEGHGGWITCLSHFPLSTRLITGSRDRTIKIWDSTTGKENQSFSVVGDPPDALWISPDERLVAACGARIGVPVKILDLESGRFVGSLMAQEGTVTAVSFSPDGNSVLTVVDKGFARLWEVKSFKAAGNFRLPPHSAAAIVSGDVAQIEVIIAGLDRIVKRINLGDQNTHTFVRAHHELITGLKASADGRRILTYGKDKLAIVWDGVSGTIQTQFRVHQEQVGAAALNPTRDLAASYDPKSGIKLWDTRGGYVLRTYSTGDAEIHCLTFAPDGKTLLAGGRDMVVRAWDVRGRQLMSDLALAKIRPVKKQMKSERKFKAMIEASQKAIKRGACAVAYTLLRDAQSLAGYERADAALELIWRMREHGTRTRLHGGWMRKTFETSSGVMDVSFSSSAINFLTAHADHTIRMWSTKTGDCLKVLSGHTNLVAAVRFAPNGREALSGGDDRTVRTWDLKSGRNLVVLKGHSESVSCVAYSNDGNLALSGSWDKTIRLWRLADGGLVKVIKGHDDRVTAAEFLHESEHVVSAGFEGIVKMWEVSSGRLLRDLKGHRDKVMSLRVSPRGNFLVSGSADGTARLWDARTGNCLRTVEASQSGVRALAFSPDEKFFVTGTDNAVVGLWSVDTGECQREFQGHSREITAVQFSYSGRFIISSSADGFVTIWELDWDWQFHPKKQVRAPAPFVDDE